VQTFKHLDIHVDIYW